MLLCEPETSIFRFSNEQGSKELCGFGTQVGGVPAKQPGEPMVFYLDRRKHWLRKLRQLHKTTDISEGVLTDLLFDNSGLSRNERLMVPTAMGGSTVTKDAEQVLTKMNSRIHTLEKRFTTKVGGAKGKGRQRQRVGKMISEKNLVLLSFGGRRHYRSLSGRGRHCAHEMVVQTAGRFLNGHRA